MCCWVQDDYINVEHMSQCGFHFTINFPPWWMKNVFCWDCVWLNWCYIWSIYSFSFTKRTVNHWSLISCTGMVGVEHLAQGHLYPAGSGIKQSTSQHKLAFPNFFSKLVHQCTNNTYIQWYIFIHLLFLLLLLDLLPCPWTHQLELMLYSSCDVTD